MDKKRKIDSTSGSNPQSSTLIMPHPPLNPEQGKSISVEVESSQDKTAPHVVCIDGWTITYTEFQPQRVKRAKKHSNNNPSSNATMNNTTKGLTKRMCFRCHQIGHYSAHCPEKNQQQGPKSDVQRVQGNRLKQNFIHGRLNHVNKTTIHEDKELVYAWISVNSGNAMVLFDPSATHSFISRKYVEDHKIFMLPMKIKAMIGTPEGEIKADHICPSIDLDIKGEHFQAALMVLELKDIDVILGMDWLMSHNAAIQIATRTVLLRMKSGEVMEVKATSLEEPMKPYPS